MSKIEIPKDVFDKMFGNKFEDGGEKDFKMTQQNIYQSMTGAYRFPLSEKSSVEENSEIEGGEFVSDSQGVQEAIGNKHSNGGIPVHLENGARILSDHLKVGDELAKQLSKDFDIKVKASDTYSKALDKYLKSIGYNEAIEESEKLIEKLDKQQKNIKDEATLGLNKEYLSEEINEVGNEINQELNPKKEQMFNLLFSAQEDSKPKEESSTKFQTGGTMTMMDDLITKYNIDPNKVKELIPEYQDGGGHNADRLKYNYNQLRVLGYTGKQDIGEMQKWIAKNKPEEVYNYFTQSGQPFTAKHVDMLKKDYKDVFTKTGIPSNKPSASYTTEEKKALQTAMGDKATKDFILEGFQDNKWDWRFPAVAVNIPTAIAPKTGIVAPTMPQQADLSKPLNPFLPPPVAETPETKTEKEKSTSGIMALPQSLNLLPEMRMPLKFSTRVYSPEYAHISPEQQLTELGRSQMASRQQIAQLPENVAAASLSSLDANNTSAMNKVLSQTALYNQQADERTKAAEAEAKTKQSFMDAQNAAAYQQLVGQELSGYQQSLQNYYNKLSAENKANYDTIAAINLFNTSHPNINYTPQGFEVMNYGVNNPNLYNTQSTDEQKTSTPKGKSGGMYNKKKKRFGK